MCRRHKIILGFKVKNHKDYENLVYQLYLAYYDARKHKRNTKNQLEFELDYEFKLIALAEQLINQTYEPKPSVVFMVNKPVKREIFAADFSDRVVHHLIYRAIYPDIEKCFIGDSYSCRKNKGSLYGVKQASKFIRSATDNYQKQAFILKLDVQGYFMHIKHEVIYQKVLKILDRDKTYNGLSFELIDYLLQKTIFNEVTQNCTLKGSKKDWQGLPKDKSLFGNAKGVGLPIGNLTSQMFGNLYLNDLDYFIKQDLAIKYYGRYVDDMLFVHKDKDCLKFIVSKIELEINKIGLNLRPKKTYLQPYQYGVLFLGQYIKPYRNYVSNRVKNSFYQALRKVNKLLVISERIEWTVIKQI